MSGDAHLILVAGALLAAGVLASVAAARLRLPALILFLGVGMAVGSDGLGWIYLDDYALARLVGTVALVVILFEGGLQTGFQTLRPVLGSAISLATAGTALTALVTGVAASLLLHFSLAEGLLLGAILSPTDGAAVFALLRGVRLPRRLSLMLEGEAGLNDPVAVMLVLVMVEVIAARPTRRWTRSGSSPTSSWWASCSVGGRRAGRDRAAADGGRADRSAARRLVRDRGRRLRRRGSLGGSGFLAVYVAGLVLAGFELPERRAMRAFHAGLAGVAEIGMFFTLGLLVFPSQLGHVLVRGTVLALVVALLARPLAAFGATIGSRLSLAERGLLGWAGLRGGIPVVLATLPVIDHVRGSIEFFDLVFFAVLVSTLLQGATVELVARRLGLSGDGR